MLIRTRKGVFVQSIVAAIAGLTLNWPAQAQQQTEIQTSGTVLQMQRDDDGASRAALDLPPRGTTQAQVRARFGEPTKTYAPVGDPPITRWDYPGVALYFEYDLFLHAVVPGDPVPLVHEDELSGSVRNSP